MKTSTYKLALVSLLASAIFLTGCGDDDDDMVVVEPPVTPAPVSVNYTYEVKIVNLTNAQPLSPLAVVLHNEGYLWTVGEMANESLETLAESGDNSAVLAESIALAAQGGAGVVMPGMSDTVEVTLTDTMPMMLSVATMLVNTNDAFTGFTGMSLENLAVGESISMVTGSYDSGTEKNSETMTTIPGPAGGGEGFNAERDDVDVVAMHPGVVSQDDGLSTSALTQAHRFDNPTMHVSIIRKE